jgi:hypothetical protein
LFPLGGYAKLPYAVFAAAAGVISFGAIGWFSSITMAFPVCVILMFLANYSIACIDALNQGMFSQKVQAADSAMLKSSFLNFIWSLWAAGACLGILCAGTVVQYMAPRDAYLISAVLAAIIMLAVWRNGLCEDRVSPNRKPWTEALFQTQSRIPASCCVLLVAVTSVFVTSAIWPNAVVQASVGVASAAFVMVSFYALLDNRMAKFVVFIMTVSMSGFTIDGACLFFFTDSAAQYPDGPHMSPGFFTTAGAAGLVGQVFGIAFMYGRFSKGWTYRNWYLLWKCIAVITTLPSVMQFTRGNTTIGIPDLTTFLVSEFLTGVTKAMLYMPLFSAMTYFCLYDTATSTFGLLMGAFNFSNDASGHVGVLVLEALHITPSGALLESAKFDKLWLAAAIAPVVSLAIAAVFCTWLPDEQMDVSLVDNDKMSDTYDTC